MIAVIGATGFTGHRSSMHSASSIPAKEIIAVVRPRAIGAGWRATGVEFRLADLADVRELTLALRGARTVVCAASLGFGHAKDICTAIAAAEPRHAVFFSTTSVFTRVPNSSRETRILAEEIIRGSGIPATIVRPTMIYGRRGTGTSSACSISSGGRPSCRCLTADEPCNSRCMWMTSPMR